MNKIKNKRHDLKVDEENRVMREREEDAQSKYFAYKDKIARQRKHDEILR